MVLRTLLTLLLWLVVLTFSQRDKLPDSSKWKRRKNIDQSRFLKAASSAAEPATPDHEFNVQYHMSTLVSSFKIFLLSDRSNVPFAFLIWINILTYLDLFNGRFRVSWMLRFLLRYIFSQLPSYFNSQFWIDQSAVWATSKVNLSVISLPLIPVSNTQSRRIEVQIALHLSQYIEYELSSGLKCEIKLSCLDELFLCPVAWNCWTRLSTQYQSSIRRRGLSWRRSIIA